MDTRISARREKATKSRDWLPIPWVGDAFKDLLHALKAGLSRRQLLHDIDAIPLLVHHSPTEDLSAQNAMEAREKEIRRWLVRFMVGGLFLMPLAIWLVGRIAGVLVLANPWI